jgi:CheY-like chemotaxis protein
MDIRKSQHDNYTYIALLTAPGRKPTYLQALADGADDFMTKPFDADQRARESGPPLPICSCKRFVKGRQLAAYRNSFRSAVYPRILSRVLREVFGGDYPEGPERFDV